MIGTAISMAAQARPSARMIAERRPAVRVWSA
jgi:hypothetical protein